MNYKLSYDELDIMLSSLQKQNESTISRLEKLSSAIENFVVSDNYAGAGAANVKEYFSIVHTTIISSLKNLLELHLENFRLYKSSYYSIDSGLHTVVIEDELSEYLEDIKSSYNKTGTIDDLIKSKLLEINDIFPYHTSLSTYSNFSNIESRCNKSTILINTLGDDITSHESTTSSQSFYSTATSIAALSANITELLSNNKDYKTDFSFAEYSNSSTYISVTNANLLVVDEYDSKSEAFELANEQETQRLAVLEEEALAELERRQAIATGVMIGVYVGAAIFSIATAGAGIGVSLMVAGTIGATTAAANNLTSQYVEYGNLIENADQVDWGDCVVDTMIGAVAGVVSYGVGKGVEAGITNCASAIIGSAGVSATIKTVTTIATPTVSLVAEGISKRFTKELITSGDFGEAISEGLDVVDVGVDIAVGVLESITGGDLDALDKIIDTILKIDEVQSKDYTS